MKVKVLTLFVVFLFSSCLCFAWTGKVVGVVDGDTIDVLRYGAAVRVRLYGIDCPEKHQDFGNRAKQYTAEKVFGREVHVKPVGNLDRYGRIIALVYPVGGSLSLNEMLVQEGLAWVYTEYCTGIECMRWREIEDHVRKEGLGVWSRGNPVPPWKFRVNVR